ncbi:MAG: DUF2335 domain-containing protein [Spirochaetota bacterium]|nr:DUF2335 domain-containing protein [Spirochaetota bacterium]
MAVSDRKDQQLTNMTSTTIVSRSGVLPPPDELEWYERITPGITDRLMTTYEKQVDHRIEIEKQVITSDIKKSYFGQIAAFIISILSITGGIWLTMNDKNMAGFTAIFVPLGSLITVFFASYKNRKDDLKRKQKNNNHH